jgi:hypothetical protein
MGDAGGDERVGDGEAPVRSSYVELATILKVRGSTSPPTLKP